jgi:hypothetical protein
MRRLVSSSRPWLSMIAAVTISGGMNTSKKNPAIFLAGFYNGASQVSY